MRRRTVAGDPRKFRELMFAQAGLRDLPVAYVVDAKGAVKVAVLEDEKIPYIAPPEHLIRAADGGQVPLLMPQRQLPRRRARQAAQLPGLLSLRRPRRRPRGRQAPAAHGSRRAALREPAAGARRPEVRARAHVFHDLADGAAGRHLGRAVVRRPVRRAHPPPDQRGPAGDARQPQGRAADPARRGRPAPAVDELQRHDQGAGAPAHRPRHRQHASSPSGAASWRRCCRACRPASSASTATTASRWPAARRRSCSGRDGDRARRPPARRGRAASSPPCCDEARGAQEPAAAPGHAHHRRRGAQLLRARHARGAGRGGLRLGRSPSTTSPSWCRRSAPRPGPTWRAASPTRSRTR